MNNSIIWLDAGYLHGMTRIFQQGLLNLMKSLIGLSERQRYEQAPCFPLALLLPMICMAGVLPIVKGMRK